jgi:hypothetical protein
MICKTLFRLLIIVQILLAGSTLFAQTKGFKTNIGYGIWESFHGGFDLRLKNYSVGIDIGTSFKTLPFDHKYYSITLDNTYFWGKVNKYDIKSWYFDARLVYWNSFEPNTTWKVLQICPSIGREFNLTKSTGINLDLGPAILLYGSRLSKNGEKVGWIYPIYPEFRIEFFYRFKK